jgi:hypothetical protein
MPKLLEIGDYDNIPIHRYYVESEEELALIVNAPAGSTAMILTEKGLKIKMLHSSGKWIEI